MSEDAPATSKGRRAPPTALAADDDELRVAAPKAGDALKVLEATTDRSTTAGSGDESLEGQEGSSSPTGRDHPGSPLSLTVGSGRSDEFSFGTTKPAALPPPHCLPKKEEFRAASPVPEGSDEDELGCATAVTAPAVTVCTAHTRTPRLGKGTPRGAAANGGRERCDSAISDDEPPEFTFGTTTPIQLPDFTKQPVPQPLSPLLAPSNRASPGPHGQQLRQAAAVSPAGRDEELALAVSPEVQTPMHPQQYGMPRGLAPSPHTPHTPMTPQQQFHHQQMSPYDAAAAAAAQNFAAHQQMQHHHMQMQQEMHMQQQMQMHHQMQQHARLPAVVEDPTWRMMEASPQLSLPTSVPPMPTGYGPSPASQDMASWSPYEYGVSSTQAHYSPQVGEEAENEEEDDLEAYLDNVRRNSKQQKAKGHSVQLAVTCDSQALRRAAAGGCIGLLFLLLLVLAIVFFKDRG